MIYSTQHHISSHLSSQTLDPITSQQVKNAAVEKQIYSGANLKQMNQSLIEEESQVGKVEEESFEFRKQKTFFCHPDDEINQRCSFQNLIQENQEFEQNPQKNSAKKSLYSGFSKSEFFTTQTLIDFPQIPRKREDSIQLMYQTSEQTALNSIEDDNVKITQSEQMIQEFDRQQLESKGKTSFSFLSSIKPLKNQAQESQNKILAEQKVEDLRSLTKRRSKLRQIQEKIKNEKKSNIVGRVRFNLKQFHLKQNISRQVPVKKLQAEELVQMILQKVQSQNATPINKQQKMQTQKLVQMISLAIIPQFQRLQNEYKGEMQKIQQKIQQITKNSTQYNLRESNRGKSAKKMIGSLNKQSVIRINLNEDFDMNEYENDCLGLDLIEEEYGEDYQRNQDELLVPMIKRTQSEDQLFISCRSEKSDI